MNLGEREELRARYRPKRVRALFIGESPPASGRFFYRGDSGLYRAMRDVFHSVDPTISNESFLPKFCDLSCYFVDLCPEPVDRLDAKSRRDECADGEESLAETIALLHPVLIVTVVRSIEANVMRAAARANWKGVMVPLPYPGRWAHLKSTFVQGLTPIVVRLISNATAAEKLPTEPLDR